MFKEILKTFSVEYWVVWMLTFIYDVVLLVELCQKNWETAGIMLVVGVAVGALHIVIRNKMNPLWAYRKSIRKELEEEGL